MITVLSAILEQISARLLFYQRFCANIGAITILSAVLKQISARLLFYQRFCANISAITIFSAILCKYQRDYCFISGSVQISARLLFYQRFLSKYRRDYCFISDSVQISANETYWWFPKNNSGLPEDHGNKTFLTANIAGEMNQRNISAHKIFLPKDTRLFICKQLQKVIHTPHLNDISFYLYSCIPLLLFRHKFDTYPQVINVTKHH